MVAPARRVVPMQRHGPVLLDPAHAAAARGGAYGLTPELVGDDIWTELATHTTVMSTWMMEATNIEREGPVLASETSSGHVRTVRHFLGFAFRYHHRAAEMETFLDGALIQKYAAFSRARPCAPATVVKVLGHVCAPPSLAASILDVCRTHVVWVLDECCIDAGHPSGRRLKGLWGRLRGGCRC